MTEYDSICAYCKKMLSICFVDDKDCCWTCKEKINNDKVCSECSKGGIGLLNRHCFGCGIMFCPEHLRKPTEIHASRCIDCCVEIIRDII